MIERLNARSVLKIDGDSLVSFESPWRCSYRTVDRDQRHG
jgi:hypothetical protein